MCVVQVMPAASDKPKHSVNKENLWVGQTRGADRAIGQDDEMHQGDPLLAVVVLQPLLSRSNRVPFGQAGCLAQRFFQSDDLSQRAMLDPLKIASRVQMLTNLAGCHPQSRGRCHAILS